jgi:DNA-binding transcriptional LysR family regulator
MSQPPLSQAIKILESWLGVELLHRSTPEARLATAGSVFLERCRALLGAATSAEEAARQAASGQIGRLRIAAVTPPSSTPCHGSSPTYERRIPWSTFAWRGGHPPSRSRPAPA